MLSCDVFFSVVCVCVFAENSKRHVNVYLTVCNTDFLIEADNCVELRFDFFHFLRASRVTERFVVNAFSARNEVRDYSYEHYICLPEYARVKTVPQTDFDQIDSPAFKITIHHRKIRPFVCNPNFMS